MIRVRRWLADSMYGALSATAIVCAVVLLEVADWIADKVDP